MCAAPESSREHAPPQCLFPEEREIGRDLRRNLITVPSCDSHNSKKSKDDEFLRAVILFTAVAASEVAKHQFLGKLLRAAARRPHAYSHFFKDEGSLVDGTSRALRIERERFDKCIDNLARAIFFDNFREKWKLPILVVSPNFYSAISDNRAISHQPTQSVVTVSRNFLGQEVVRGENPDVFKYRLRYDETTGMYAFAAIFYDFFEVYSVSSHTFGG
jgi:hypothetical protein